MRGRVGMCCAGREDPGSAPGAEGVGMTRAEERQEQPHTASSRNCIRQPRSLQHPCLHLPLSVATLFSFKIFFLWPLANNLSGHHYLWYTHSAKCNFLVCLFANYCVRETSAEGEESLFVFCVLKSPFVFPQMKGMYY